MPVLVGGQQNRQCSDLHQAERGGEPVLPDAVGDRAQGEPRGDGGHGEDAQQHRRLRGGEVFGFDEPYEVYRDGGDDEHAQPEPEHDAPEGQRAQRLTRSEVDGRRDGPRAGPFFRGWSSVGD